MSSNILLHSRWPSSNPHRWPRNAETRALTQVLRTAGKTKRDNPDKAEAFLMYRTLRDMNLSKLVAQDVPLFLSLLADLFPSTPAPPKGEYPEIEAALKVNVSNTSVKEPSRFDFCWRACALQSWRK